LTNEAGLISEGEVNIAAVAPGLFAANANGAGVAAAVALRVRADGSLNYESINRYDAQAGRFLSTPIDLGPAGELVFLTL
jgi:uncharacterized protein (TIGR03437 family)